MDYSIISFAAFLNEGQGWEDRVRLAQIGIGEGLRVLKVRVDWQNLGQKKFDGTLMPHMKCWFYENWPLSTEEDDSWVEYPDRRLVDLYTNGDPGDVELVDYHIMKIARDHDADLIWETIDGTWRDVQTGEHIGKLHRALGLE
jgi:hypothetical protein